MATPILCDSATADVVVDGALVGVERFSMTCSAARVVVRTQGEAYTGSDTLRFGATLYATPSGNMDSAVVTYGVGSQQRDESLRWIDSLVIRTRAGRQDTVAGASGRALLVRNLFAPLALVIARFEAADSTTATLPLFPDGRAVVTPDSARGYFVTIGNTTTRVTVDSAGRLSRVEAGPSVRVIRRAFGAAPVASESRSVEPIACSPDLPQPKVRRSDFTVQRGSYALVGELMLPVDKVASIPAVVLVSGSGPQDRHGTPIGTSLRGYRPFDQLVAALVAKGVGVLRLDDRGVGESGTGDDLAYVTTSTLAHDAAAAISALRNAEGVDPERLGVVGHSEGATIAFMLAARGERLSAIVALAPWSMRGDSLLAWQLEKIIAAAPIEPDSAAKLRAAQQQMFTSLRQGDVTTLPGADWVREFIDLSPDTLLSRVTQPVLVVHGEYDHQAPPTDGPVIVSRLRASGHRDASSLLYDGVNHLLVPARTGAVSEYRQLTDLCIPEPIVEEIAEWTAERLSESTDGR